MLTLAPAGRAKSDNLWHPSEYRAEQFEALCRSVLDQVEILGVFDARRLRIHALAPALGWDSIHSRLGITSAFYDRFTPFISARDFAVRPSRRLDRALDFLAVCR